MSASSRYYCKNYILIKFLNFLFFNYLINCFAFWYYIFSNFVGFDIYFLFFLFFLRGFWCFGWVRSWGIDDIMPFLALFVPFSATFVSWWYISLSWGEKVP